MLTKPCGSEEVDGEADGAFDFNWIADAGEVDGSGAILEGD